MKPKIIHYLIATLWSAPVLSSETITISNWLNNKKISEIRKIYKGIQTSSYPTKKKSYNTDSPNCSTYPIKEKSIHVGSKGKIRKLSITQLVSHNVPLLIERIYDSNGIIRFVFAKYIISVTSETRIYFNKKGDVIWAVNKDNNIFTKADYANGDWETKPETSKKAEQLYNKTEKCPSIK